MRASRASNSPTMREPCSRFSSGVIRSSSKARRPRIASIALLFTVSPWDLWYERVNRTRYGYYSEVPRTSRFHTCDSSEPCSRFRKLCNSTSPTCSLPSTWLAYRDPLAPRPAHSGGSPTTPFTLYLAHAAGLAQHALFGRGWTLLPTERLCTSATTVKGCIRCDALLATTCTHARWHRLGGHSAGLG